MKITKLLVAMMAVAVVCSSCKKDEDEEEAPVLTRLVKMEITGTSYSTTETYSYNEDNLVSYYTYAYQSESSTSTKNITYTYNSEGEPTEWEQTGDSYGNGVTTADISNNNITITKPSGSETTYSLNSDKKFTFSTDGTFDYNYFWIGENLDRKEGLLSMKGVFDLSHNEVRPSLGVSYWERSENLVNEVWIYNYADQSDMSKLYEYTYQFNADGTPATATMYNGFYSSDTFYVTFTYEEY